jgi:sugar phosphate isomerase/epimerase
MSNFHISERNLSPLGTTGVDHAACAAALVDVGYRHWVSIEMRPPDPDRILGIERALARAITDYAPFFSKSV